MDVNSKLSRLFDRQIIDWPLARDNYSALKQVEEREVVFDRIKKISTLEECIITGNCNLDSLDELFAS